MEKTFISVALVLMILLLIILPAVILTGCAKLISTDYATVEATIVDEYHRSGYSAPMRVGKVMTLRHIPAVHYITVEYNGIQYNLHGRDVWNQYKDLIGYTVPATMKIDTYDDGTVKHDITAIGGENQYG